MIVCMSSSNKVCDLSVMAESLLEEGFSTEEVIIEIFDFCAKHGLHVNHYDVIMLVADHITDA